MRTFFADTEIVLEIHRLQFGKAFNPSDSVGKTTFSRALLTFSKRVGGVTEGTIHNWLKENPTEPNNNGKRFLLLYVHHLISDKLIAKGMDEAASILEKFLKGTVWERRTGDRKVPASAASDDSIDRIVIDRLGNVFSASRGNGRSISNDLFNNGDPRDSRDWSYFLVYRYSTNRGELLKSFLVIQKPEPEFKDYGFNHFVWGGKKKGQNRNVFRECEGAVLALEKAYYLVSYNFVVGVNKRTSDPNAYETARQNAKKHPIGMGLLSAEYEEITRNPGLFSGVTMTIAAGHQPVVARLAFLHLGTKTSLGCELSDRDVDLRELLPDELEGDLRSTVGRLKKKQCKTFGTHLQDEVSESSWEKKGVKGLAQKILEMIDNTPAWETVRPPRSSRRKTFKSQGALETFGPGRPRE